MMTAVVAATGPACARCRAPGAFHVVASHRHVPMMRGQHTSNALQAEQAVNATSQQCRRPSALLEPRGLRVRTSRAVLYITSTLEKTCRIEIPAPHSTSRQCTSARRAARCAQAHSVHSSGSHVAVVLVSSHVAVVVLVSTSRRASCSSAQCAQQR